MGVAQVMKRIPRIKFPPRHSKPSGNYSAGSTSQPRETYTPSNAAQTLFSRSSPSNMAGAGKASLQPKRTPVSQEEIESILLGGCI